jgi:dGTPase
LNEDLTEAIALGHDLGHTPFGHDGERALDRLLSVKPSDKQSLPSGSCLAFRHNEQSVRVVEIIERDGAGLNLTAEVRDGILNHSSKSKAKTLEGDVVRLSDKIAYINHDIEDAVSSGILTNGELPANAVNVLGDSKSKRITSLIVSVINNSIVSSQGCEPEQQLQINDGLIRSKPTIPTIRYDDETQRAHDELRAFMFERVYNNPKINTEKGKAVHVVEFLYGYYKKNQHKMPKLYQELAQKYGGERAVCDYISGMTDDFAVDRFIELCVPKAWGRNS